MSDLSTTPASPPRPTTRPGMRVQKGLAFLQRLRLVLYALLVGSALFSFFAGSESQHLPAWSHAVAPILFGAFLLIFAVYKLTLIRARHYPASTGLFQIGLAALVFIMLLPGPRRAISGRGRAGEGQGDDVIYLMGASDPRVRALAAEVAGDRNSGPIYAQALSNRLEDSDARVRDAARSALAKLLAVDLPPGLSDDDANMRLHVALQSRGWLNSAP